MKIRLDNIRLGNDARVAIEEKQIKQTDMAANLDITQGQIANILRGQFKIENPLIREVCKYLNIDLRNYRLDSIDKAQASKEAVSTLALVCRGNATREKAVLRILRALQEIS